MRWRRIAGMSMADILGIIALAVFLLPWVLDGTMSAEIFTVIMIAAVVLYAIANARRSRVASFTFKAGLIAVSILVLVTHIEPSISVHLWQAVAGVIAVLIPLGAIYMILSNVLRQTDDTANHKHSNIQNE